MAERPFTIESAIVCDDIRREDNGKAILIGVYFGDVIVPKAPALLSVWLWFQARANETVENIQFRAEIFNDSAPDAPTFVAPPHQAELHADVGNTFLIALGGLPLSITGSGHLSIQAKYGEHDWIEILKKRIHVNPAVSSEQPQRP